MKPAFRTILLLVTLTIASAARTEEPAKPASATSSAPLTPAADQGLLALCPADMPPACACVAHGEGIRVMPANEAYKSRKKVLLVGPKN